jgi:hypothetical protein
VSRRKRIPVGKGIPIRKPAGNRKRREIIILIALEYARI